MQGIGPCVTAGPGTRNVRATTAAGQGKPSSAVGGASAGRGIGVPCAHRRSRPERRAAAEGAGGGIPPIVPEAEPPAASSFRRPSRADRGTGRNDPEARARSQLARGPSRPRRGTAAATSDLGRAGTPAVHGQGVIHAEPGIPGSAGNATHQAGLGCWTAPGSCRWETIADETESQVIERMTGRNFTTKPRAPSSSYLEGARTSFRTDAATCLLGVRIGRPHRCIVPWMTPRAAEGGPACRKCAPRHDLLVRGVATR